jgi:hypothetical protein
MKSSVLLAVLLVSALSQARERVECSTLQEIVDAQFVLKGLGTDRILTRLKIGFVPASQEMELVLTGADGPFDCHASGYRTVAAPLADRYLGVDVLLATSDAFVATFRVKEREPSDAGSLFTMPITVLARRVEGKWVVGQTKLSALTNEQGDVVLDKVRRALRDLSRDADNKRSE